MIWEDHSQRHHKASWLHLLGRTFWAGLFLTCKSEMVPQRACIPLHLCHTSCHLGNNSTNLCGSPKTVLRSQILSDSLQGRNCVPQKGILPQNSCPVTDQLLQQSLPLLSSPLEICPAHPFIAQGTCRLLAPLPATYSKRTGVRAQGLSGLYLALA